MDGGRTIAMGLSFYTWGAFWSHCIGSIVVVGRKKECIMSLVNVEHICNVFISHWAVKVHE